MSEAAETGGRRRRQRTRPDAPESGTIPCCRARKQISEDEGKGKAIGWLCTVLRGLPEGDESERDAALMAAVGGRTVLIPDAVEGSSKIEKGEHFQVEFKSTEEGLRATKFTKVNAPVIVPRATRAEGEEKAVRRRRQRTRPDAPETGTIPCCRARKLITEEEGSDGKAVGWLCTVLRSLPEGDESERDSALMAAVGGRTVLIPTTVEGSDKVQKGEHFQVEFKSTEEGLRATKFTKVNAPVPRPPREPKEKKEGEEGEKPTRNRRRRRNGRKPKGDDEAVDKALSRPGDKEGEGEAPKPRSRRRRQRGAKKEGEGEAKEGGAERKPRRRGRGKPAADKEAAN